MSLNPANLLNIGYTLLFTLVIAVILLLFGYMLLIRAGREAFLLGLSNLRYSLFQSLLTGIGIVVGVGGVIAVISMGDSLRQMVAEEVPKAGGMTLIELYRDEREQRRAGSTITSRIPRRREQRNRETPLQYEDYRNLLLFLTSARAVSAESDLADIGFDRVEFGNLSRPTAIIGTTPEFMETSHWYVERGRFLSGEDLERFAKVAVIGHGLARELFGEMDPIGQEIRGWLIHGVHLQVIGMMRENGTIDASIFRDEPRLDRWVFVPMTTYHQRFLGGSVLRRWYGKSRWVERIRVKARSVEAVPKTIAEIKSILRRRHQDPEAYTYWTAVKEMAIAEKLSTLLKLVLGVVAGIALVVAGIGIMNMMLVSVTERTKEIGLRKALGAKRRDLLFQFLVETSVLSLVGGILGIALGIGLSQSSAELLRHFMALSSDWPKVISPQSVIVSMGVAFVVGVVSGLYPASRAARLTPVEALRAESSSFFTSGGKDMPNKWRLLSKIALLLVTIAFLGGVATRRIGCSSKSNAKAENYRIEQARVAPFVVRVTETGTLEAPVSVEVKSNVEGEIVELNVEAGDVVKKGQVLLRIDDEQIREEVQQAEADYKAAIARRDSARQGTLLIINRRDAELQRAIEGVHAAQAQLEAAQQTTIQQIGQAETEIITAQNSLERDRIALQQAKIVLQQFSLDDNQYTAQLNAAKIAHENAARELERRQQLYQKRFISQKALEEVQEAAASASVAYENAQKNVSSQQKSIESQKATIEAQKRVLQSRQTTLAFQEANLEILKASRAATERQVQADLASAQLRLKELQETIESEKEVARLAETSAKASVLRAESALKTARQRLGWTTVIAPMNGTVTNLSVEVGEIITSGRSAFASGPPLMTIANLSQMIVRVAINEVDMGQIAIGQRAEITPLPYPNKAFAGRVRQIAPSGESKEGVTRFFVEIEVEGEPKGLMPGMTADVDIFVVEREEVLQVPIEAVQEEDAFSIQLQMKPQEKAMLRVDEGVTIEMQLGKTVQGRVASTEDLVQLTVVEALEGWRSGAIEFGLVLSDGKRIPSLSGQVTQTKSRFVEVVGGEETGTPNGSEPPSTKKVPVAVGMRQGAFYEIVSGISPGTSVLVRPPR